MSSANTFYTKTTINAGGRLISLERPQVMGIINLTPDSFYAGSRKPDVTAALQQAERMLTEGAAFLDLGAYSSRPGAEDISIQEEADRLLPVIEALASHSPDAIISVDTFRASIAEAAVKAGAHMINDISGGQLDEAMFDTVARLQVPYILMHMRGTPQTMNKLTQYDDIFLDVLDYFVKKHARLNELGVHDVIIDPGYGFAKEAAQGYELLRRMNDFQMLGLPLLAGVSRKRMVYGVTGTTADEALNATTALNTIALMNGANILRVHDVKEAVEAVKIYEAYSLHPNPLRTRGKEME